MLPLYVTKKGAVGKTALTINLGAALAEEGKKVCLIDLDPQGHLTEGVGMKHLYLQEGNNLYKALTDHNDETQKLIHHVPHEKFDIIPSNYEMMLAEQTLFMTRNREHKLRALLSEVSGYDWILIDCPPNLGNLTDNALNASRLVIIPIQAETTSVRALDLLFDQIESIEQGLKIKIQSSLLYQTSSRILPYPAGYSKNYGNQSQRSRPLKSKSGL